MPHRSSVVPGRRTTTLLTEAACWDWEMLPRPFVPTLPDALCPSFETTATDVYRHTLRTVFQEGRLASQVLKSTFAEMVRWWDRIRFLRLRHLKIFDRTNGISP
ncbi:hypothetical protein BDA96_04G322600 [Sorghum bicolor]|uniref:Uncharacterized protein n=1 Tax=Sorghum bicolor TaxID=4558 RepID=A0A921R7T6_SORBI|nr:hypothetical protein BDA96_04G322600 [Sorghum bicolor]